MSHYPRVSTFSPYCTLILCACRLSLCLSRDPPTDRASFSTRPDSTFDSVGRSQQPFGSRGVVCLPLLREDFARLQLLKSPSSREDVAILQLKHKHFIAIETPPPRFLHPHSHPLSCTHTHRLLEKVQVHCYIKHQVVLQSTSFTYCFQCWTLGQRWQIIGSSF